MSAALPPTVKCASAVGHMSKERVVKDIEQMWCRASKSATPLQYASAGDSPPTTLLYFTLPGDNLRLIHFFACTKML